MEFIPHETMTLDKERRLRLSRRVLRKFKDATGSDFNRCLAAGFSAEEMFQLLYASFSEEDKDYTEAQLEEYFHAGLYPDLIEKLTKLVTTSFPKPAEDAPKNSKSPMT